MEKNFAAHLIQKPKLLSCPLVGHTIALLYGLCHSLLASLSFRLEVAISRTLVAGGFIFGGLMFGPDLDIYSRQFQRWGFLRFIWLPYQKSLRHRSFLSHGPIIGTTLRVIYLSSIVSVLAIVVLEIAEKLWNVGLSWQFVGATVMKSSRYSTEFLALFLGLELGAMSHYVSDWGGSTYKRVLTLGVRGLLPRAKMKKRKVTTRTRGGKPKTTKNRTNGK